MGNILIQLYTILQLIFLISLGLAALYIFFFAFAGLFYRQKAYPLNPLLKKIAVLIPGYKEDNVIVHVAEEALKQDYPHAHYDVVIIADSFQPETIRELEKLPLKVIGVKFDKSTKSKIGSSATS